MTEQTAKDWWKNLSMDKCWEMWRKYPQWDGIGMEGIYAMYAAEHNNILQFIIKTKSGKYIGIDGSSGGYPWETDNIFQAKIWSDKKAAWEYNQMFKKDWTLHTLTINTIPLGPIQKKWIKSLKKHPKRQLTNQLGKRKSFMGITLSYKACCLGEGGLIAGVCKWDGNNLTSENWNKNKQ